MEEKKAKLILELARKAIETQFSGEEIDMQKYKVLNEKRGLFVTLHKKFGKKLELRGCIGFVEPIMTMNQALVEAARSAAFGDPRFPSLEEDELKDIEIEVSVLTVPEQIEVDKPEQYLKRIKIGEDGLIIRGRSSGLLLPQVATEWNFTAPQFLNCLCQKAGLPFESWKDLSNKIYKFQAEIINEKDYKK